MDKTDISKLNYIPSMQFKQYLEMGTARNCAFIAMH